MILQHSQEVMAHNTAVAEERVQQLHNDHEATKAELSRLGVELEKVKEESHKRKKQLKNQQTLIQATANNYHKVEHRPHRAVMATHDFNRWQSICMSFCFILSNTTRLAPFFFYVEIMHV